jgi:hypothetical protein
MRSFILFILFTFTLIADDKVCYSIQITDITKQQPSTVSLSTSYPPECKVMSINNKSVVRCGCYETSPKAKEKLPSLLQNYKEAYVVKTYKYRFDALQEEKKSPPPAPHLDLNNTAPTKPHAPVMSQTAKSVEDNKSASFSQTVPTQLSNASEEELKLMVQSFLFNKDLKNAFLITSIAYKKFPTSPYWNQQMADIASWSGNPNAAINAKIFLYQKDREPKLRDEIINYGLSMYQYMLIEALVIDKTIQDPSDANVKLLIFVENAIGTPEKAAKMLKEIYAKNSANSNLLTQEFQLALDLGDLDLMKDAAEQVLKNRVYTLENVSLLAYYYYLQKDIKASYNALLLAQVSPTNPSTDKVVLKYYQLLSDVGWYVQEYATAAKASKHLIDINSTRLTDYVRVVDFYTKSDSNLSMYTAKKAYLQFKQPYLFYSFADLAFKQKEYKELADIVTIVDESNSKFKNEAQYFLIKAKLSTALNEKEKALGYLNQIISMSNDDTSLQLNVFWFYIDNGWLKEAKNYMLKMENSGNVDPKYYFPFASTYYSLGEIDKANSYMQKILSSKSDIASSKDFKSLQAYIYQMQGHEESYYKTLYELKNELEAQSKESSELGNTNDYLTSYLNSSMPISGAERFETMLKNAQKHLTPESYSSLSYSWAMRNNADEMSHAIYTNSKNKELWMQFSDALTFKNKTEIENLLDNNLSELSKSDAVNAAKDDGQIALAQTLNFDELDKNSLNQGSYVKQIELSKLRSNQFDVKTSYYNRDPLFQKYISLSRKNYIARGYEIEGSFSYYKNNSLDTSVLDNIKSDTKEADIKLQKSFDENSIALHVSYNDFLKSYYSYGIGAKVKPFEKLLADISYEKNMPSEDSMAMVIAGKKDMFSIDMQWTPLSTLTLDLAYQKNSFTSQDNQKLGDGDYTKIALSKKIKESYPDITTSIFVDHGTYNTTSTTHGIIDTIQNPSTPVLAENFYNIGGKLDYGMLNQNIFSRSWRPYFSVAPFYNTTSENFNFGLAAGIGGKIFHQNHLNIEANYSQPANGLNGVIFQIFLKYQMLNTYY